MGCILNSRMERSCMEILKFCTIKKKMFALFTLSYFICSCMHCCELWFLNLARAHWPSSWHSVKIFNSYNVFPVIMQYINLSSQSATAHLQTTPKFLNRIKYLPIWILGIRLVSTCRFYATRSLNFFSILWISNMCELGYRNSFLWACSLTQCVIYEQTHWQKRNKKPVCARWFLLKAHLKPVMQ